MIVVQFPLLSALDKCGWGRLTPQRVNESKRHWTHPNDGIQLGHCHLLRPLHGRRNLLLVLCKYTNKFLSILISLGTRKGVNPLGKSWLTSCDRKGRICAIIALSRLEISVWKTNKTNLSLIYHFWIYNIDMAISATICSPIVGWLF